MRKNNKIIKLTAYLLVGLLVTVLTSTQNKIDSLKIVIETTNEDTTKINALNTLGWQLMYSNPDTAILLSNNALVILNEVKNLKQEQKQKLLAGTLGNFGAYYWLKGDYPKALDYYLKALKIDESLNNKEAIAKCLRNIAGVYQRQADYPKALDYDLKALKMAEELGNKNIIAVVLGSIGFLYQAQADYFKALDYYLQALKIDEALNNKEGIANRLGNIALVYQNQGDYPKALDYHFKALKFNKELADKKGIAGTLINIGILYWYQSDYPKALEYNFKGLKIAEEIGFKQWQSNAIGCIGMIYHKQAESEKGRQGEKGKNITGIPSHSHAFSDSLYNKALDYYLRKLKMDEELGNKTGIAAMTGNIGSVYLSQDNYSKALHYYFRALKMAEEVGDKNVIAAGLGCIGELYTKTGKFKEAEEYLKQAIAIDSAIGSQDYLMQFEEHLSHLYDTLALMAEKKGKWQVAAEKHKLSKAHYKKAMVLQDTLFNIEKHKDMTRLATNHEWEMKLLQEEQAEKDRQRLTREAAERRNILQYSAIALGIFVLFGLLFFVGKLNIPNWAVELSVFMPFLLLFEFLLVLTDPYVEQWTGGEPGYKLIVNAAFAGLIFPLHSFFESVLKGQLFKTKRQKISKEQASG